MMRSTLRGLLGALALAASLLAPGCVGTPLPDPPSLTEALVSLHATPQTDAVRVVGLRGAIREGGVAIRITDPAHGSELVATNADGSFGRIVPGAPGDTFYVELVLASEEQFVGAYTAVDGGAFTAVSPGPDTDGDHTPDVIDCAPTDAMHAGQRCGAVCATDSDCATGQVCVTGVCTIAARCVAETCNGIDDDCDGTIDDGDPGGGAPCTPTSGACPSVFTCVRGPACLPDTPLPAEICGNGVDDDCNGLVDDGC